MLEEVLASTFLGIHLDREGYWYSHTDAVLTKTYVMYGLAGAFADSKFQ